MTEERTGLERMNLIILIKQLLCNFESSYLLIPVISETDFYHNFNIDLVSANV